MCSKGLLMQDKNASPSPKKKPMKKFDLFKTTVGLLFVFIIVTSFLYSFIQKVSVNLTEESAINSAEIYVKALEEFRGLYTSEVVTAAKEYGMDISHDYHGKSGVIPLPATLSILLGKKIGEHDGGAETRLYSPYPFPWREKEGGLRDEFSTDAWNYLAKNPTKSFSRFEQVGDTKVLKFAKADVLRAGCVGCHNNHELTPKNDWKLGEVRGVLEVTLPMKKIIAVSESSLSEFSMLLMIISIAGIGLTSFFVIKNKQSTSKLTLDSQLKSRINDFNDLVQSKVGLKELSRTMLSHICLENEANHGAIFTINKNGEFDFLSGYALKTENFINKSYALGEGLIGQAALDQKTIFVRQIPENYIDIESGIGGTSPTCLMLYPIVKDKKTLAVIELATLGDFNNSHHEFILEIEDIIAISFEREMAKNNTEILLEINQQQVLELQNKQEDLTLANQELEEKALDLKKSEEELKSSEEELRQQSDELRATNEELEEKQDSLQSQALRLIESKKVIEKTADELQQSSKYKSEFLANMSHELRTPLNSLLILSRLLLDNKQGNLTNEQLEEITIIHEGGQSLLGLINDVMDLSKVEAGMLEVNIESISLNKISHYLMNLFTPISKKNGVQFTINIGRDLPDIIQSDKQRIEQILKNFLSNAFKFTKLGSVDLSIECFAISENNTPSILQNQSVIAFSVSDTGVGIPKEKQDVIFNSFQQADGSTSREYGGTGLGLSISKELAHLLGGEIKLTSEVGKGSCFTLYLPQSVIQETESKTEPKTEKVINELPADKNISEPPQPVIQTNTNEWLADDRQNIQPSDKSLLIIEDDKEFVKILVDMAEKQSFKTIITNKGREGVVLAKEHLPTAIILDLGLPDIDGLNVLQQLKNNLNLRHIPIHVLTAKDKQQEAMQLGAISYLQKPVDVLQISSVINSYDNNGIDVPKNILVIEDDHAAQVAIQRLIASSEITVYFADTAQKAISSLDSDNFDCIILDLGLPDISGLELVHLIREHKSAQSTPIIIYTAQDLTNDEQKTLRQLSLSIVIKGKESPERLLDDVVLFLHHIDKKLSSQQQETLKMLHDENEMLLDRRVLVVDDDMRNVFAMTKVLEDYGLIVSQAENGQAALNTIESANKPFELILMDIMMPVMDGIEATKRIRELGSYKETPIISLTAKAMPGDKHKCIEAGASEYLTKPIDTQKLLSILRVWLYQHKTY